MVACPYKFLTKSCGLSSTKRLLNVIDIPTNIARSQNSIFSILLSIASKIEKKDMHAIRAIRHAIAPVTIFLHVQSSSGRASIVIDIERPIIHTGDLP
jgi:hypothetical protein